MYKILLECEIQRRVCVCVWVCAEKWKLVFETVHSAWGRSLHISHDSNRSRWAAAGEGASETRLRTARDGGECLSSAEPRSFRQCFLYHV